MSKRPSVDIIDVEKEWGEDVDDKDNTNLEAHAESTNVQREKRLTLGADALAQLDPAALEKEASAAAQAKGKAKGKAKNKGKDGNKGKGKGGWEFKGPTAGGGYRLNVKNLSNETTTKEQLTALFEPFGTVSSADIKKREDGGSRGFGFVVLATEEEGKKAIAAMNGKTIGGKALNVAPAERRPTDDLLGGKGKGKGFDAAAQTQAAYMMQMQQAYMMQMQQMQYQAYMAAMAGMPPYPGMLGADALAAPVTAPGEYIGTLKSINAKNGYGFITCDETKALYNRDVYIDNDLLKPGAAVGDQLRFTVTLNAKGHPKASTATSM